MNSWNALTICFSYVGFSQQVLNSLVPVDNDTDWRIEWNKWLRWRSISRAEQAVICPLVAAVANKI